MIKPKFKRGDVIECESRVGSIMLIVDTVRLFDTAGYFVYLKDALRKDWEDVIVDTERIDSIYELVESQCLPSQIELALELMGIKRKINVQK